MSKGDPVTVDSLLQGGILKITREYWDDRVPAGEIPLVLIKMTHLAISDALVPLVPAEEVARIKDEQERRRREDERSNSWTAWNWLFDDENPEISFKDVCDLLGVSVTQAREQIVYMWMTGLDFETLDGRRRRSRVMFDKRRTDQSE